MMFDYLFSPKQKTGDQNSAQKAKKRLLELKLSNADNQANIDVTALSKELMKTLSRYYPHIKPEDVNIEFSKEPGYYTVAATVPDQPNKQKS